MQRPLLQVNSLMPQDRRVQFWCSSRASAQSASPSHTQSRRIHFRWGGWLLTHVNSVFEHVRLAGENNKMRHGDLQEDKQQWWHILEIQTFQTVFQTTKPWQHCLKWVSCWGSSTAKIPSFRYLIFGAAYKSLDPPWARKPERGRKHKVTSEAGEIRNASSLDLRPTGDCVWYWLLVSPPTTLCLRSAKILKKRGMWGAGGGKSQKVLPNGKMKTKEKISILANKHWNQNPGHIPTSAVSGSL